jgi:RNA polymerase sigma-70 factor (sigma-E family)
LTDNDGLAEFVRGWLPTLSRVAYLLTGDHDAAQDLVQAAMVQVVAKWSRVAGAERPQAYARRILYHEHISLWRRRSKVAERLEADVPDRPGAGDDLETVVRRVVLQRAMGRLTARQRAVLVLRFFEDLPEADVAAALQCSVGTVKSQVHHALGRLRELAPELAREFAEGPDTKPAEVLP